ACARPAPSLRCRRSFISVGAEVCTTAARRSACDQLGCACLVSAAMPATFGVAIDVPERIWKLLPVPEATETTDTPGAVIPGRSALSPMRGPCDEKLAILSKPALAWMPVLLARALAGAGPPVGPLSAAASAWATPKNGIVTGS